MILVLVPVRYPLTAESRRTLQAAAALAIERGGELSVLHVNIFQDGSRQVTRETLQRAVERAVDDLPPVRYVIRSGFLVEQVILDEAVACQAAVVVIGRKQGGRWRRMRSRLVDEPDVEQFLRDRLDCEVVTVPT